MVLPNIFWWNLSKCRSNVHEIFVCLCWFFFIVDCNVSFRERWRGRRGSGTWSERASERARERERERERVRERVLSNENWVKSFCWNAYVVCWMFCRKFPLKFEHRLIFWPSVYFDQLLLDWRNIIVKLFFEDFCWGFSWSFVEKISDNFCKRKKKADYKFTFESLMIFITIFCWSFWLFGMM